uniref:Uncharacterized protein n=2 Tax=Paenibacillus athensensis TaxID=1967502 RepID=A0A4Y8Q5H5_9BACL
MALLLAEFSEDFSGNADSNHIHRCPECESEKIDFQYVGEPGSRIGFLSIWYENCLNGIHISRARVPESAKLFVFGDRGLADLMILTTTKGERA